MIPLDWKERLKKDTIDFYLRKLPEGDYDIDIVYNAYPERIEGHIPHAVITYVARTLASKIAKKSEEYFDFYDYLYKEKGENGRIIFAYVIARAMKKKPDLFLEYIENILFKTEDHKASNLIVTKAIYPLLKKNPEKYLDLIINWLKKNDEVLTESLDKTLKKFIKYKPEMIKELFGKLETLWLYATPQIIKLNVHFLKKIYKVDTEFYHNVYEHYKNTRNPVFADILCGAIACYSETIQKMVDNWSRSGNVKLKKIGQHGQKVLKRKKKKGKK